MKKIFGVLALCLAFASCSTKENDIVLFPESDFNTEVDGKQVTIHTLKAGDVVMQVTNFGARVVALWAPDKNGNMEDVVLGYNNIDSYINNPGERFLGAVVGPYANRIAGGTYTIGEETYNFPQNNNGQTLHGGLKGLDMVVWDVFAADDSTLVLTYTHPDGQDGKPGNLEIFMTYTLTSDNEFKVDYMAQTDKATHVNISHHSFFNLKGEGNGTINDHVLYINASKTTPVDSFLIPSGEIADVTGTPFDFREPHRIDYRIDMPNEHLRIMKGMSACWVIRDWDGSLRKAADLYDTKTGRGVETWTTEPALLTYTGRGFSEEKYPNGKYGPIVKFAGMLLETIHFPDSPNQERFPSTVLRPGEKYHSVTQYRFYAK